MLKHQDMEAQQKQRPEFNARSFLAGLKGVERSVAEEQLRTLKHPELGAVFVESGGPAGNKKKPIVWLREQILWRLSDF